MTITVQQIMSTKTKKKTSTHGYAGKHTEFSHFIYFEKTQLLFSGSGTATAHGFTLKLKHCRKHSLSSLKYFCFGLSMPENIKEIFAIV